MDRTDRGRSLVRLGACATLIAGLALGQTPWRPAAAHSPLPEEIEDLSAILAHGPARALDYLRRGELYRLERNWAAACADYDRAERLDPALPTLGTCRAALALDMGDAGRAKQLLDAHLRHAPGDAQGLFL